MESSHLSGHDGQYPSSLQVSDESGLLRQNSDEEKDVSLSDDDLSVSGDDASVSDFDEEEEEEEEEDIVNNEDYLHTEAVDDFEANNENEKEVELCVDMEFSSAESAYEAYRKYGCKHGFDIRRQRTSKKNKKVVRIVYVCSKEGFREERSVKRSYERPITRCGCDAQMSCYLQRNGRYKVTSFEPNHNHVLVKTPMKHMLKGSRAISNPQKKHAEDAELSGISAKASLDMMSTEVGGRQNLGFLEKDYRNYIYRKRMAEMKKGDAGAVFEYFQKRKKDNASFYNSMLVDEDDKISNIFWADDRSISDYKLFGDVVCFDTTYKTNKYDRPFAPFVGVNHHRQTIVFGAALLYDETTESFEWLFQTFLEAMSGKQPRTILTDQCAAMANAIGKVFPETKHRLCVWHIYQNAAKKLGSIFRGRDQFAADFGNCVYDHENETEWLSAWSKMLEKHELTENKWLKDLFGLREKWARVYGRNTFTADMMSTQRSESMNSTLKRYDSQINLFKQ